MQILEKYKNRMYRQKLHQEGEVACKLLLWLLKWETKMPPLVKVRELKGRKYVHKRE